MRKRPAEIQTEVGKIVSMMAKYAEWLLCARQRAKPSPVGFLKNMFFKLQVIKPRDL